MDKSFVDILRSFSFDNVFNDKSEFTKYITKTLKKELFATGINVDNDTSNDWSKHKIDINITNGEDSYSIFVYYKANNFNSWKKTVNNHSTAKNEAVQRFYEDLAALDNSNNSGAVILLSNIESYWDKTSSALADFTLEDGAEITSGVHNYRTKRQITLKNSYGIKWSDKLEIKDIAGKTQKFRYLVIPVGEAYFKNAIAEINSFDDFLKITSNPARIQFYRGQNDFAYVPLPGALRSRKENYEYNLFAEVISQNPNEYYNITNLEKLTKIQHQELPTRLLDISSNPLVSLFFSLSSFLDSDLEKLRKQDNIEKLNKDLKKAKKQENEIIANLKLSNDAWFFAFAPDYNAVRNFASDRCRILSALPYFTDEEQSELRYDIVMDFFIQNYARFIEEKYGKSYVEIRTKLAEFKNMELDKKTKSFKIDDIPFKYSYASKYLIFWPEEFDIKAFELKDCDSIYINPETGWYGSHQMNRLHAMVTHEQPAFRRCAYPTDLLDGVFVRPIFNSNRMVAQQGAFMMFGLSSFWNTFNVIKFLSRNDYDISDVLSILILNDDKFLKYDDTFKIKRMNLEKIKEYVSSVMEARLYHINPEAYKDLLKRIQTLGITKESLGRSDLTTVYYLNDTLPDKED